MQCIGLAGSKSKPWISQIGGGRPASQDMQAAGIETRTLRLRQRACRALDAKPRRGLIPRARYLVSSSSHKYGCGQLDARAEVAIVRIDQHRQSRAVVGTQIRDIAVITI